MEFPVSESRDVQLYEMLISDLIEVIDDDVDMSLCDPNLMLVPATERTSGTLDFEVDPLNGALLEFFLDGATYHVPDASCSNYQLAITPEFRIRTNSQELDIVAFSGYINEADSVTCENGYDEYSVILSAFGMGSLQDCYSAELAIQIRDSLQVVDVSPDTAA